MKLSILGLLPLIILYIVSFIYLFKYQIDGFWSFPCAMLFIITTGVIVLGGFFWFLSGLE